jgi:hypothetical protein
LFHPPRAFDCNNTTKNRQFQNRAEMSVIPRETSKRPQDAIPIPGIAGARGYLAASGTIGGTKKLAG